MPGAAFVLRRALLIWGWGHLALGDRRAWLLVLLQPIAIGGLLFVAWQLIDGTRWLAVFVPLVVLLVFWIGQAAHAYRRAIALGSVPGGELQLALFLPLVLAVLTTFWLIGGRHGSPAATVQAYMEAWESNQPAAASTLFATPRSVSDMTAELEADSSSVLAAVTAGRSSYGEQSGLDPKRPFNSLRVSYQGDTVDGHPVFVVDVVRSESFETTILGFIPTAGQRTLAVDQVLWIKLVEVNDTGHSALITLPTTTWRIYSVSASPI